MSLTIKREKGCHPANPHLAGHATADSQTKEKGKRRKGWWILESPSRYCISRKRTCRHCTYSNKNHEKYLITRHGPSMTDVCVLRLRTGPLCAIIYKNGGSGNKSKWEKVASQYIQHWTCWLVQIPLADLTKKRKWGGRLREKERVEGEQEKRTFLCDLLLFSSSWRAEQGRIQCEREERRWSEKKRKKENVSSSAVRSVSSVACALVFISLSFLQQAKQPYRKTNLAFGIKYSPLFRMQRHSNYACCHSLSSFVSGCIPETDGGTRKESDRDKGESLGLLYRRRGPKRQEQKEEKGGGPSGFLRMGLS